MCVVASGSRHTSCAFVTAVRTCALPVSVARAVGSDYAVLAQAISLVVALGAGGLMLASSRSRAWLSVMISKHFFEHRYDYRAEWMRFTATLAQGANGDGGDDDRNLNRRVAKAPAPLDRKSVA